MYLLPVTFRSTTCTMISGKSEDESGHGFARITEIASGVTVFAISTIYHQTLQSKKVESMADLKCCIGWRIRERWRNNEGDEGFVRAENGRANLLEGFSSTFFGSESGRFRHEWQFFSIFLRFWRQVGTVICWRQLFWVISLSPQYLKICGF